MSTESPPYPLYGPTYTLFRVSPLHNGTAPPLASLAIHARRFRDIIKGDTLRGIQIAAELQSSGRTATSQGGGAFMSCTWELLGDEASWQRAHPAEDDDEDDVSALADVSITEARGVRVEVQYERTTYSAVLFGSSRNKSTTVGFTKLPLLFVKMPAPLREAFVGYLTTAFDARISPMNLRSAFLSSVLETVLSRTIARFERDLRELSAFPKGLQLQLSFPSTAPDLRTLDIHIEQSDLVEFLKNGRLLSQSQLSANTAGPFTTALDAYITQHLALSLTHPAVVISKFALGPYALSSEGKVKVTTATSEGAREIWKALLKEASPERLLGKEEVLNRTTRQADGMMGLKWTKTPDGLPIDPPPPYELHDSTLRDEMMDDV
jgi:hypothetical protein